MAGAAETDYETYIMTHGKRHHAPARAYSSSRFANRAGKSGIALTLATALAPPVRVARASSFAISSSQGVLDNPEFHELAATGVAPLWVAGQTVNSFAYHLRFMNMPPHLVRYFRAAGGEWKSLQQANAIWETIPRQVRAGGPAEISRFLNDMDWSHVVAARNGGASTADNGIFETRILNRIRSGENMTPEEAAAARRVIQSKMIGSIMIQTVSAMFTGAVVGLLIGGLVACLEYGLQYAEGEITWRQMVEEVVKAGLSAGGLSFVITGLIVGLALLFPAAIAIMAPVLFVLQIVSLVFLAQHGMRLAADYWEVLKGSGLVEEAAEVLGRTEEFMQVTVDETSRDTSARIREWTGALAQWTGWKRAWGMVRGLYDRLGADRAWAWFASQTNLIGAHTSDLLSPLKEWGHISRSDINMTKITLPQLDVPEFNLPRIHIDVDEMKETVARVIKVEFRDALTTTGQLKDSLDKYVAEGTAG